MPINAEGFAGGSTRDCRILDAAKWGEEVCVSEIVRWFGSASGADVVFEDLLAIRRV